MANWMNRHQQWAIEDLLETSKVLKKLHGDKQMLAVAAFLALNSLASAGNRYALSLEAEALVTDDHRPQHGELSSASDGSVLIWSDGAAPGATLTLYFDDPSTDPGALRQVFASLVKGPEAGIVRLSINGRDVGWPIDLWATQVQVSPPINLGTHDLKAEGNKLVVTITGSNAKAKGSSSFGLDRLFLTAPEEPPPAGNWLVSAGPFKRIYDPSVGEDEQWYINDHSIIQGDDGIWHLFGITREEPPDWMEERNFAHATSGTLTAFPWKKEPFALTADYAEHGEVHLWAPYVFKHEDLYYMYYCAGAGTGATRGEVTRANRDSINYRTHLATSRDLKTWTRHPANPMFTDGWDARDPMVLRLPDEPAVIGPEGEDLSGKWILYYTATEPATGGNYVVAYRTSDDLVTWSDRRTAFRDDQKGRGGGSTESPFVVRRGDWYYLFLAPRGGPGNGYAYAGTDVFRSRNPTSFRKEDIVGHLPAHAAEIVQDTDGRWFVTHCGWGQGGVYLAELRWHDGADVPEAGSDPATSAVGAGRRTQ